jgi:hypothetical protein
MAQNNEFAGLFIILRSYLLCDEETQSYYINCRSHFGLLHGNQIKWSGTGNFS